MRENRLIRNLGFDELGLEDQGFLPPQVTRLGWDHVGDGALACMRYQFQAGDVAVVSGVVRE